MVTTPERLHALFECREDGALVWRVARGGRALIGAIAGRRREDGYLNVRVDGRTPVGEVDHINRNRNDNSPRNLREVSRIENRQNMRKAYRSSTTGLQGVRPDRGRFQARISVSGKRINLGCYATAQEAHAAYLRAKDSMHIASPLHSRPAADPAADQAQQGGVPPAIGGQEIAQ